MHLPRDPKPALPRQVTMIRRSLLTGRLLTSRQLAITSDGSIKKANWTLQSSWPAGQRGCMNGGGSVGPEWGTQGHRKGRARARSSKLSVQPFVPSGCTRRKGLSVDIPRKTKFFFFFLLSCISPFFQVSATRGSSRTACSEQRASKRLSSLGLASVSLMCLFVATLQHQQVDVQQGCT